MAKTYTFELSVDVTLTDQHMIDSLDEYKGDFSDVETDVISYFSGKLASWLNACTKQTDVEMRDYTLSETEE